MSRRLPLLAWAAAALGVASLLLGIVAVVFGSPSESVAPHPRAVGVLVLSLAMAFPIMGALVASRQPRNPIGWLLLWFGVAVAFLSIPTGLIADHAFYHDQGRVPGDVFAAWLVQAAPDVGLFPGIIFIPLLFPTGRPPSPRWWPVVAAGIAACGAYAVLHAFQEGPLGEETWGLTNPVGFVPEGVVLVVNGLQVIPAILGLTALVVRFRRARGDERLQLKWLVFVVAVMFAGLPISFLALLTEIGAIGGIAWATVLIGFLGIPVATGIAILRYRLYEIDVIVRRTLVYGALVAVVVAAYVGLIALADALLRPQAGVAAAAAATGIVAILFDPLRARLQVGVNRLLYGQRDDPAAVVAALGARLQAAADPTALMPAVVDTVATTLRLPYVAIELDGDVVASRGTPAAAAHALPIVHRGRPVGRLLAAPRPGQDALHARDLAVLEELAREAGAAAEAAALMTELQRSRARIVAAREEERRAIRNDLHEGVGPALAAIVFQLDAARNRLPTDREAALGLVHQAGQQTKTAIADVRVLVDALKPSPVETP